MPSLPAFTAWRQIALICVMTRKAKSHRNDGDLGFVIEHGTRDTHPLPQAVARGVVEGKPRRMHLDAGCLACDEQPRGRGYAKDRARLMRKGRAARRLDADPAGSYAHGQRRKLRSINGFRHHVPPAAFPSAAMRLAIA